MTPLDASLQSGVDEYASRTGTRLSAYDVDPRRSDLHELYRSFSSTKHRLSLDPSRGAWVALEHGIKPMLRLVVARDRCDSLVASLGAQHFVTRSLPVPIQECSIDGSTSFGDRVVVFVGKNEARINQAAEIDEAMLSNRTSADLWKTQGRMLGTLLGYPPCCVDHFTSLDPAAANPDVIRHIAESSERFDPLLNNLTLTIYHTTPWFPCRYDCSASLLYARDVDKLVADQLAKEHRKAHRALAMPRVYLDDRRQLIFDGAVGMDGEIHYREVLTPFSLDRNASSAPFEWVFWVDVVQQVRRGHHARIELDTLRVWRGSAPASVVELRTTPTLLPFMPR